MGAGPGTHGPSFLANALSQGHGILLQVSGYLSCGDKCHLQKGWSSLHPDLSVTSSSLWGSQRYFLHPSVCCSGWAAVQKGSTIAALFFWLCLYKQKQQLLFFLGNFILWFCADFISRHRQGIIAL